MQQYVKQKRPTNVMILGNAGTVHGTTEADIRAVLLPFCSDTDGLLISLPEQRPSA
jgi:hypothetical protein